jgi:pimeloyl-ACP methyl ester carboxylesterase
VAVASPFRELLAGVSQSESSLSLLGSDTHYWAYGPENAAATMVFVHGYRGDHHGLEPVIAQLRDVRIIAPDLPGFGASTPMTDAAHDIPGYVRWLAAFLDALDLPADTVVLGHSFGSIVVAHALAGGAIRPSRIVLVNPIAALPSTGWKKLGTSALIRAHRLAAGFGNRAGSWLIGNPVVVRTMSAGMAVTRQPALRRWIHEEHARYFSAFADMPTVLEAFAASVTETVTAVAPRLDVPALLIGAEQDQISSSTAVRELAAAMPHAELVMIEGVGHLIHYEKPREAASALVSWLGAGRLA